MDKETANRLSDEFFALSQKYGEEAKDPGGHVDSVRLTAAIVLAEISRVFAKEGT